MEPIESEKQKNERVYLPEIVDFVTIKPDGKLTKKKALEIKQRIDDVQNDLDFLRDWLKHDLKCASAVNLTTASYIRGDALWAWDYLQAVYRFLAKVISNAQD